MEWTSRIEVSKHALARCRELLGWDDVQRIRGDIRCALLLGRLVDVVPNWTRGNGRERSERVEGVRYAYDAEATRCWVLTTTEGRIVVKTLLLDHATERGQYETRHLRHGLRRR